VNKKQAVAGLLGVLLMLMLLGTCSTHFNPPSDVTAEQLHVINTQVDTLHEEIVATRRPDAWLILVFAASILVPIGLAVWLLWHAEKTTLGRDEIFHVAIQHRLIPDMVNAALKLQDLKKTPTLSDRLARRIRMVKRWREHRPALPSRKRGPNGDEEVEPCSVPHAARRSPAAPSA